MKIGFHYHVPAFSRDGRIYIPGYLGVFIDSISKYYEEIILFLHSPRKNEIEQVTFKIKSKNIKLIDLGIHSSIPKRYINFFKYAKIFKQNESELDLIIIRAGTPLLPLINFFCKTPLVLFLVSNATEGLDNLPQPNFRLFLIKLWAKWYQRAENRIASRNLTIVNSAKIYEGLKGKVDHLFLTKTTTLKTKDFYFRNDTCKNKTIRLLFAGRITENKGLLDIIRSMAILKDKGYDLHLDLVGMVDGTDDIFTKMESLCLDLNLNNSYTYHGFKNVGNELFEFYRRADIFVNASKGSAEGFPRTLWEAMASCAPVVSTSVSSIPKYIGGASSLAEPNNPKNFSEALEKVMSDKNFRKNIIKKGFALAKDNTLEQRALDLKTIIENYMQGRNDFTLS